MTYDDILVNRVHDRLHKKDKNYLCITCGETGGGKSEVDIGFAMRIDPTFNIERVVFSTREFLKLLNDGDGNGELPVGAAIVWEELGISADNRQFFSIQNRAISYAFETFRHRNFAIFMNVPGLNMIDLRVRCLSHQYIETRYINKHLKICNCKVYDMQYSSRYNKVYYKYPKAYVNGVLNTITEVNFHKPSDSIIIPYKAKKLEFTRKLNLELSATLDRKDEKENIKPAFTLDSIVNEIVAKKEKFLDTYKEGWQKSKMKRKYINDVLIRQEYPELSRRKSIDVRVLVEKTLGL